MTELPECPPDAEAEFARIASSVLPYAGTLPLPGTAS